MSLSYVVKTCIGTAGMSTPKGYHPVSPIVLKRQYTAKKFMATIMVISVACLTSAVIEQMQEMFIMANLVILKGIEL